MSRKQKKAAKAKARARQATDAILTALGLLTAVLLILPPG